MEPTPLSRKKCLPCTGHSTPLSAEEITSYSQQIEGWDVANRRLKKTFRFKNFTLLMDFVNRMAKIAEEEGHHPDFSVHYNILDVTIWTHAIDDLSEDDFILAAKIDAESSQRLS
jgi:4a-hydroxytetrahydrobiopterin dehydratase